MLVYWVCIKKDWLTLVSTNEEALDISALHAIQFANKEKTQLFQWGAKNNNMTALHAALTHR